MSLRTTTNCCGSTSTFSSSMRRTVSVWLLLLLPSLLLHTESRLCTGIYAHVQSAELECIQCELAQRHDQQFRRGVYSCAHPMVEALQVRKTTHWKCTIAKLSRWSSGIQSLANCSADTPFASAVLRWVSHSAGTACKQCFHRGVSVSCSAGGNAVRFGGYARGASAQRLVKSPAGNWTWENILNFKYTRGDGTFDVDLAEQLRDHA